MISFQIPIGHEDAGFLKTAVIEECERVRAAIEHQPPGKQRDAMKHRAERLRSILASVRRAHEATKSAYT